MIREAIHRIIEYKVRFGLHPLIATDADIERETGVNRAEIARISHELTKDGRMYYGRTINGKYYALNDKLNSQDIMKGFQQAIKDHLEKMAAQDEAFAEKYAAKCEAEQDSISNCCKYITNEVQKKYKQGNSAVLTDAEVFGMAMHYYDENVAAPKSASNCTVVMSKAELTPEDEEAIRQEARAAAEEAAAKRKEAAERKKKEEAERKRKEWEEADLLFNFDEE